LTFVGAVPLESAPAKLDAKAKKVLPVLAKLQKKYQRLDAREKEKLLTKADGYRQKFKSVLSQIDDEVAQHYGLEINVIHEILGMSEPAALPKPAPAHDHPLHPAAPEELHQDPLHHHHEPAYPLHGHDHSNMVHVHNPEPVRHVEPVHHVEPVRHLEPEVQIEPEVQAGILERAAAA